MAKSTAVRIPSPPSFAGRVAWSHALMPSFILSVLSRISFWTRSKLHSASAFSHVGAVLRVYRTVGRKKQVFIKK